MQCLKLNSFQSTQPILMNFILLESLGKDLPNATGPISKLLVELM